MTPKEKATWIVHQMYGALFHTNAEPTHVKQCALIAVNEIIKNLVDLSNGDFIFIFNVQYWQEVKQEINKL